MSAIDYPSLLDRHEALIDRDIAADRHSPPHAGIPIWETDADIEALYLALQAAERRRDEAGHEADLIEARIDVLEDTGARRAERELQRDYMASVL